MPNDILSCILRVASRWLHLCLHPPVIHAYVHVYMCVCGMCACVCDLPSGSYETADIETLVDDFVAFYVAGEAMFTLCD